MCARRVREAAEIVYEGAERGGQATVGRGRDHRALKLSKALSDRSRSRMGRWAARWSGGGIDVRERKQNGSVGRERA